MSVIGDRTAENGSRLSDAAPPTRKTAAAITARRRVHRTMHLAAAPPRLLTRLRRAGSLLPVFWALSAPSSHERMRVCSLREIQSEDGSRRGLGSSLPNDGKKRGVECDRAAAAAAAAKAAMEFPRLLCFDPPCSVTLTRSERLHRTGAQPPREGRAKEAQLGDIHAPA